VDNFQFGEPLARSEVQQSLEEVAVVQGAAPVEIFDVNPVPPAAWWEGEPKYDEWTAYVKGPDAVEGQSEVNTFVDLPLPPVNEAGSLRLLNDAEIVMDEAGTSDPSRFQTGGRLAGFKAPPPMRLNNLPHPMTIRTGKQVIIQDNLDGLSEAQKEMFGVAGDRFDSVFQLFENTYSQGLPAFEGEPLR